MNALMLVLRWLHIFTGVYWAGSALLITFIITPAANATGDAGRQFIGHLMTKTKLSASMMAAASITVLAGAIMYWIDSGGFTSAWTFSETGIAFGIGSLFGIAALGFGHLIPKVNGEIGKLSAQIQGQPTVEQTARIQELRKKAASIAYANVVCMIVSVTLMATARYIPLL